MKKLLYTIGILMMMTAIIKPIMALGADNQEYSDSETYSTSAMFARILPQGMSSNLFESFGTTGGTKETSNDDLSETDAEKVGKDLYLKVLKKTILDPEQQAVKNTAGKYGISQNDMEFVRSGVLSPLLNKRPTLEQDQAIRKVTEMRQRFDEEQKKLSQRAELEMATTPTEIFANGDLSDSGFDLIVDLQIIEKLLFMKSNPIDIGKAYNKEKSSGGGGETPPAGQEQTPKTTPETPQAQPTPAVTPGGGAQQTTPPGQVTEEQCPPGYEEPAPTQVVTSALQPNCTDPENLQKTIESFEKQNGLVKKTCVPKSGTEAGTGTGTQQTQGQPADGGAGTVIANAIPDTDPNADFMPEIVIPPAEPVQPAEAGNWKKERVCLGKFCLFIKFYYETPTSKFMDSDNCIACHIEKIDDTLKKVLSHSLSPNKVPGNMIETPKCKNGMSASLSAISMNWNVQFMPIKTPINDELILGSSVQNDWKYFCEATAFFPASMCKIDPPTQEIATQQLPSLEEEVSKRLLSNMPDTVDYNTILTGIDKDMQARTNDSLAAADKVNAEREVNPSIMMYKSLLAEIDQFNYYFLNINDLVRALHEKVSGITGEQACTNFKNKKNCT